MAIEASPPPAAAKTPATEASTSKGKAASGHSGKEAAPSGFSAILDSLGDDSKVAALPADGAVVVDTRKPDTDVPLDAAALLAQAMQVQLPKAEEGANPEGLTHAAPGRAQPKALDTALTAVPLSDGESAVGLNSQLHNGRQGAATAKNGATNTGASPVSEAEDHKDLQASKFSKELDAAKILAPAAEPVPVTSTVQPGAEKQREISIFKSEAIDNKLASPVTSAHASIDTSVGAVVDGNTVGADVRVAEQVTFWIGQDVHKAEMTLDGIGEKPVEVSISMNGNEAHVAFRTDEYQTREVLHSASSHLKDMLHREGLMLGGVSVGTSGAGDSGGQERKSRQGGRPLVVSVAPAAVAAARLSGAGSSGRAVDLFV